MSLEPEIAKTILFVCTENACRSQMAEGWARSLLADWRAFSAGSRPRGSVDAVAIAVMQEAGIDISGQVSKGFDALPLREFDCVVTMGCAEACPFIPATQRVAWDIPDPAGKDVAFYRQVRGMVRDRVANLPGEPLFG